jgi:predicted ribosome quality control (RQC) complex YloA/Tae2 family protein
VHTEILHAVLPEIRDALLGRRVTKVELSGKYAVLVRFADTDRDLWLSAHPELSRAGLVERPPDVGAPRRAPDNLDEPLLNAVLSSVEGEPGGRVARFRFERRDARHPELTLIAELIPRFANVILTGNDDRILWCRREFTGPGRPRQVAPGETYAAPGGAPEREGGAAAPVEIPAGTSPNAAADAWYRPQEEDESTGLLLAELRRTLVKRRKRAAKALVQIEARLEEAGREAELREHAELLTAHLKQARRGMASVKLPAFDGSGEVEIALDPKLDPRGNAEALFKKARRVARGRDEMITQQSVQREELERVDAALERLDPPPAPADLREIVQDVAPSLLAANRSGGSARGAAGPSDAPQRPSSLPEGFNPRRYVLPGGWEVWVGRSAKQNDELTHRWASQRDLWFHARGAQGSHTVLRVGSGKGQPPRDIIQAAAAIAAWFSKARNSNLVPVAYTEKRYVRKPRKSPVGTALMMREKVVMVTPALPEGESE